MTKASILDKEIKLLWGKGMGKCAICHCDLIQELIEGSPFLIGEMAHIEGEKEGSARFNQQLCEKDRSKYPNLILLCPNHHTIVDKDLNTYTVENLRRIKKESEEFFDDTLKSCISDITFAELDQILKYIIGVPNNHVFQTLTLIPLNEKIKNNSFSPDIQTKILMGLTQVKQVKKYIETNPDLYYEERLQSGFVKKYEELFNQGIRGETLFYSLWDFASSYKNDYMNKAAGLSILVYFFELCEVFSS